MQKQSALITGASGGIGLEFAKLLAQECDRLVLVSRNRERLEAVKKELKRSSGATITIYAGDLSQPETVEALFGELERDHITVDILVNNAGFGDYGPFNVTEWQKEADMIAVNITALTELTKRVLKGMLARRRGKILNVSSTAAFQPGPMMAVYYASKAYVQSFSEALANEVHDTGVTVTALCPGPTATGFALAARMENSRLFRYASLATAASVARYGYEAMMKGRSVAIHGMRNRIVAFCVRLAPRKLVSSLVRWLHTRV